MSRAAQREQAESDGRSRRVLRLLGGLTVLSLLLRLLELGGRTFHWDEGRVGYWILRYHETGEFTYRPIIHGPFIQHVDALLFHAVPATEYWARAPIAVITAALPLSAWLFRRHLDDRELVALGLLLTVQPLLLYYSRFMRSDPLVGAFAFIAFALLVFSYDTRSLAPMFAAVASIGLAFASKENAILYVLCFGGAAAICYDHRLLRAATDRGDTESKATSATGQLRSDIAELRNWLGQRSGGLPTVVWVGSVLTGLVVTFLAVVVLMYAPRPEAWGTLTSLSQFLDVTTAATVDMTDELISVWLERDGGDRSYLAFFHDMLETLAFGAPVLLVLAAVGFLADGYGVGKSGGKRRTLVAFTLYWTAASVIGYPIATDIQAPWAAFHIVLPLTIPGAVGLAALVGIVERELPGEAGLLDSVWRLSEGRASLELTASLVVASLLLSAGIVGVAGLNVDYWNSASEEDKQVIQWAQPENELGATMADVERAATGNAGPDVLFYGTETAGVAQFYVADESSLDQPPPGGPSWHSRLPLPWYLESADAAVTSSSPEASAVDALANPPPVVIAYDDDREAVENELDGYEAREHAFKLWGQDIVVFIDESTL